MQQVGGVSAAGNSTPVTDDKGGSVASPKESETPAPTIVQNIAYDAESRWAGPCKLEVEGGVVELPVL